MEESWLKVVRLKRRDGRDLAMLFRFLWTVTVIQFDSPKLIIHFYFILQQLIHLWDQWCELHRKFAENIRVFSLSWSWNWGSCAFPDQGFNTDVIFTIDFSGLEKTLEKPYLHGAIGGAGAGLGFSIPVKANWNATAYKDILYNRVLPNLWQEFGQNLHHESDGQVWINFWPYRV